MKRFIQSAIFTAAILALPFIAASQAIVKGSGILYTNGAPTHSVNLGVDAEVAIDTASGLWYEFNRDAVAWEKAGFRIQHRAISIAPTGAPQDKQSEIVINDVDSLYQWRGGAWRHLNKVWDNSATNELQTLANTSNTTTHTATLSNSGGSLQLAEGSGVTLTTTGTTLDGVVTIAAVDASITNELQTYGHAGTTSYTNTLSNSGGSFTLQSTGIISISHSAGTVTFTATEVDGSTTNELQTYSHAGTTTYTNTLSGGGGSWSITGAGIAVISQTGGAVTVTATEVDGSVSNEGTLGVGAGSGTSSTLLSTTSGANAVTINAAGILAITESTSANGGSITLTATEVDGSTTNELQTLANTSNATTHTATLSNSGGSLQLAEGTGISLATTGTSLDGVVTITATDPSASNELQIFTNSSDATNHYLVLSDGGGSIQFAEGSGISFATTGTSLDGIITISATGSGTTDLTFTGTSSPVTLNSSSGTDVTFTAGGINSFSASGTNITITATEVDGSTTNELQTYGHAGTTTYTNTLSGGGGSWSITGAGIAVISQTAGAITVTATEVDGSITNEGLLGVGAGSGTSSVLLSNTSTATGVTINAAGILAITESTSSNGGSITLTATEVDGSTSNELQTYSHAGTTTYTNTLSSGGGSWSITGAGIAVISQTAGAITVTATEVDGSVTNEIQTYSHAGTTTYTNTLSSSGGSWSITGAGIAVISQTAGAITVTATEVDGSITNEGLLGVGAGSGTSSVLLSNTSTATGVTINAAGILAITESTSANGGSITLTATEVDGSTSNELQTLAGTSDATSHTTTLSNSGGSLKLVEGTNITLTTSGTGLDAIVTIDATGGGGTPAGGDFQVQYYNGGAFGAESVFNYNPTTNRLVVGATTPVAVLHARGADDVADRVFLAENSSANDVLAIYATGRTKWGDNETYPYVYQAPSAGGTGSYTANGLSFESDFVASTGVDLFSFHHPANGNTTGGPYSIVRSSGTWQPTSGSAVYNGFTANSTINATSTASGRVNMFNGAPTITQATGGVNIFNATPSVTAASGGLRGYYSDIASGTGLYQIFMDGTAQSRFDGAVGIKADPVASTDLYVVGNSRFDAQMLIRGAGTVQSTSAAAALSITNTTASDTWYFGQSNDGTMYIGSGNASQVIKGQTDGTVETIYDLQIDFLNGTPTKVAGVDGSGVVGQVNLGSGVALSGGELPLWNSNDAGSISSLTSTALADVTGLSFAVTANLKYEFWACIKYSAAATTTGSAFSIDCPAGTVSLQVESALTNSTQFTHAQNAENTLLASASSAYTSGNIAYVRGIVEPTSGGTCIIRGATEVGSSAITVQGVSNINWREIK